MEIVEVSCKSVTRSSVPSRHRGPDKLSQFGSGNEFKKLRPAATATSLVNLLILLPSELPRELSRRGSGLKIIKGLHT